MCINSLYSTVKKSQANYSIEISYFHDEYESITKPYLWTKNFEWIFICEYTEFIKYN